MTHRPVTPGYNKHLDIKFTITKSGQRRAFYWGSAIRWLPLPVSDAEMFITQGLASLHKN
jgi:hypothetical protein